MSRWKIAGVQMDCRLGDKAANLDVMRRRLREAAQQGARLIVFPECALTGYGFESKEDGWPHAEALPGPATERLAADCRELSVWAVFGLLERDGDRLFNACALVGPDGFIAGYRKVHLPHMGIDRFATPGDRPFAVHDLGELRVGMNVCYDGSFPEAARVLTLLGADLIVLPTNWPSGARAGCHLPEARALENHVYYLAVNRAGEERGFRFVGRSRLIDYEGEAVAAAGEGEEIVYGEIEPERARQKRVVVVPGKHEVDRVGDRRPEMYGPLVERPALGSGRAPSGPLVGYTGGEEAPMKYKIALHRSDEGISVSVPALPGCWSEGDTEEEALANIQDAIREYLAALEDRFQGAEVREVEVRE